METLRKSIALFCLELGASLYIGIGVVESVADTAAPMGSYLAAWTMILFGVGLAACLGGMPWLGPLRDKIVARAQESAQSEPAA